MHHWGRLLSSLSAVYSTALISNSGQVPTWLLAGKSPGHQYICLDTMSAWDLRLVLTGKVILLHLRCITGQILLLRTTNTNQSFLLQAYSPTRMLILSANLCHEGGPRWNWKIRTLQIKFQYITLLQKLWHHRKTFHIHFKGGSICNILLSWEFASMVHSCQVNLQREWQLQDAERYICKTFTKPEEKIVHGVLPKETFL